MSDIKRVHCFQQVPEEGLGCIADWLAAKSYPLTYTRFYEQVSLPKLDSFDVLVVMGGPMGVYDVDQYPWLVDEKTAIKAAVEAGKVVIGICLGAQFIASALGARVYPGCQQEIGWFPLTLTARGAALLSLEEQQEVFHWHGDTFDLPCGADLLASSAATPHQGFVMGNKVLALQFHLEVNAESLQAMTRSFADELQVAEYVQSAQEILSKSDQLAQKNQLMFSLLDRFVG